MNKILLAESALPLADIYPGMDEKKTRETLFAFSILNAWEVAYLMKKDANSGEFKELLRDLIGSNKIIEDRWRTIRRMRNMYDQEFQKVVDSAFP